MGYTSKKGTGKKNLVPKKEGVTAQRAKCSFCDKIAIAGVLYLSPGGENVNGLSGKEASKRVVTKEALIVASPEKFQMLLDRTSEATLHCPEQATAHLWHLTGAIVTFQSNPASFQSKNNLIRRMKSFQVLQTQRLRTGQNY